MAPSVSVVKCANHCQASIENKISFQDSLTTTTLKNQRHRLSFSILLRIDFVMRETRDVTLHHDGLFLNTSRLLSLCIFQVAKFHSLTSWVIGSVESFNQLIKMWILNEMKRTDTKRGNPHHGRRKKKAFRKKNFWCSIYKRQSRVVWLKLLASLLITNIWRLSFKFVSHKTLSKSHHGTLDYIYDLNLNITIPTIQYCQV